MEVAHINLNDGTVEGLRHRTLPIFSIQYHPEASPGPTDSAYFFRQFVAMLDREKGLREKGLDDADANSKEGPGG
jgi:carbamoyl-phosphate synthase small subunit